MFIEKALMFETMAEALTYIFQTRRRLDGSPRGLDEYTRDIGSTRSLLERANLLDAERRYVTVTGSRGKGSVSAIMSKLLEALGMRVGTLTSPHLVHWNERIRVNGLMIPTADFLRILGELQPHIDAITGDLSGKSYLSPQGIFLAIALRYFDLRGVELAVLEVGRGGRFDDIALAPNALAVFTPIVLEHTALLGDSLERIAWHKAGIIKKGTRALSLPQAPEVVAQLALEAAAQDAELTLLETADLARWVADTADSQVIRLGPYSELLLPLLGRYQIDNATLAIRAVELLAGDEADSGSATAIFRGAIHDGLARAKWLGRVQMLDEKPAIYVDGAITVRSAESFVRSLSQRLTRPVVAIVGIPRDRDYAAVYKVLASVSQALIITETDINPNTRFPTREEALGAARGLLRDVYYAEHLEEALAIARERAGESGTILMAVSLMLVGECMLIWDVDTSAI